MDLIVSLLVVSTFFCNSKQSESTESEQTQGEYGLRQIAFTNHHNGFFRRFAFPPGTFLIFVPELTLPVWRDHAGGFLDNTKRNELQDTQTCNGFGSKEGLIEQDDGNEDTAAVTNSDVQIASPFYVYFDKLGWTHDDSIYNVHNQMGPYIQEYLIDPTLQLFGAPPSSSFLSKSTSSFNRIAGTEGFKSNHKPTPNGDRMSPLSHSHRLSVFHRIEEIWEKLGATNGRACLLRTICELHEFPFDNGRFGILGEITLLVLGSISGGPCLNIYAKAENSGKNRNCEKYTVHCQQSVFEWYWKLSHA